MRAFGLVSLIITIGLIAMIAWLALGARTATAPNSYEDSVTKEDLDPVISAHIAQQSDLIKLDSPVPNETISSPLKITGKARGTWFFEASFPVTLTDWDGRIIAEHYATADGEWMTEEFVDFTASLEFTNPYNSGDPEFMSRGTLILKKDNPSGLPEHDDYLEIPVYFAEQEFSYGGAIDSARDAAELLSR